MGRATRFAVADQINLVNNGDFSDETSTDTSVAPFTGWANNSTHDATNKWTISSGACTGISDGGTTVIRQITCTAGKIYLVNIDMTTVTSGSLKVGFASSQALGVFGAVENAVGIATCPSGGKFSLKLNATANLVFDNVELYEWVGNENSGGGCTVASFSGDVSDYMGADGSPLYEVTGAAITDGGGGTTVITDAGNFGTDIVVGTLVNCDFSATYTDGIYEITAANANSVTIDMTYSTDVPTVSVWVGGAFPNVQLAWDDDSTNVSDGANFHNRYVCTNVDETFSTTLTPAGGDRGSSKFEHTIGYANELYVEAARTGDDWVYSDMDVESATRLASQFTTSYYKGAIECIREVESAVQKRPNGDQVIWDANDNDISAVTITGDNIHIRNIYMGQTSQGDTYDVMVDGGNDSEGTTLISCWLDGGDDLIEGSTMDEAVFMDCYFGNDIDNNQADYSGMTSTLFQGCVFNGNGKTYAAYFIETSSVIGCLFYKGTRSLRVDTGSTIVMNSIMFDAVNMCIRSVLANEGTILYNNIFSPVAQASPALRGDNAATFIGSNNIAYSASAGVALDDPFMNDTEGAFWLDNTIEQDPQFKDAANFDFRSAAGIQLGIGGFDPDLGASSIGSSSNAGV
ncbi:MAG: hypothetical protein GY934_02565, partial [Gammaproteobacteria bacterium]|nr:hypothetical protein [Gammaproteobacteria bacterium]